jgi:hypothetical protein
MGYRRIHGELAVAVVLLPFVTWGWHWSGAGTPPTARSANRLV